MDKEIELAKSWFVLAQLLMILAGFLFASGGVVLTNTHNTMMFGLTELDNIPLLSKLNSSEESYGFRTNLSLAKVEYAFGSVISHLELFKTLMISGLVLFFFSLAFFFWGQRKIAKIRSNNKRKQYFP
jgi:TRAP-type C4-dicarboxylate transport system permease small subunit